jgi:hypothetical protein
MALRKAFRQTCNSDADLSARFAQTGRCDTHSHRLTQNLDQHHDPTLAIGHLVDALDTGKRRFGQTNALTLLEQPFWLDLNRCFLRSQQFDQAIIHPRAFDPEADKTTDALGGTDRCPALG